MQVINTSGHGDLTFERTWINEGIHIGKLTDGGYCHIGGPPISSRRELQIVIPPGKQLDEAIDWWENKDKVQVKKDRLKIIITDDGYAFSDGSPIKSVGDLISHIPPGPGLDAAVLWYVETHKDKIKEQLSDKESADDETAKNKAKLAELTCACGKICTHPHNLTAHQKACPVHQAQLSKAD